MLSDEWTLFDFALRLQQWIDIDDPPASWRRASIRLVERLSRDPFTGARQTFENDPRLWSVIVPGAEDETNQVLCTYLVDHEGRSLRCGNVSTLRRPI